MTIEINEVIKSFIAVVLMILTNFGLLLKVISNIGRYKKKTDEVILFMEKHSKNIEDMENKYVSRDEVRDIFNDISCQQLEVLKLQLTLPIAELNKTIQFLTERISDMEKHIEALRGLY